MWLRKGSAPDSYENDKELSGSKNGEEFNEHAKPTK
jgi:hypothetical protein